MLAQNQHFPQPHARNLPDPAKKPAARVLVVDDEWLVRWSVSETLRAHGFDVVEAGDGRAALSMFESGCDLVLLDLHLPDSQDLRVLLQLRSRSRSVPVIIMTAFATRELVEEAAALGAAVVSKPFDLDDLTNTVERALAGRVY